MIHYMKLHKEPFALVASLQKTVELRLYDEKRRLINVGDIIEFTNTSTLEKIRCLVKGIHVFENFKELYEHFDSIAIGYKENEVADYKDMELYYSLSEIEKWNVVAIEIEVIKEVDQHLKFNL